MNSAFSNTSNALTTQLTTTCKLPVQGVDVKPLCHQLTLVLSLSLMNLSPHDK